MSGASAMQMVNKDFTFFKEGFVGGGNKSAGQSEDSIRRNFKNNAIWICHVSGTGWENYSN